MVLKEKRVIGNRRILKLELCYFKTLNFMMKNMMREFEFYKSNMKCINYSGHVKIC